MLRQPGVARESTELADGSCAGCVPWTQDPDWKLVVVHTNFQGCRVGSES